MLHLQDLAKQGQHSQKLTLTERLPAFVASPCQVSVNYHVEQKDDFYLIYLKTTGELVSICQRCAHDFIYHYDNQTIIAVCRNDERAEQLLEFYECIVAANWQLDLTDLIIDELHLYGPQFHPEMKDCDSEINQILTQEIKTY